MSLANTSFQALFILLFMIGGVSLNSRAANEITPSQGLSDYVLPEPELTPQQQADVEMALKFEADEEAAWKMYEEESVSEWDAYNLNASNDKVDIELYQRSKVIGKQFILVRHNGKIRFVFAVSAGASGHSTPEALEPKAIIKQRWRHMSTLYPEWWWTDENNMDHSSYFIPAIAFHSTMFGLYHKLGRADSHGCVRLARPEARALYSLIAEVGHQNTRVYSYKDHEPNPSEIDIILTQLKKDLDFIKYKLLGKRNGSIRNKENKGDVPFDSFKDYLDYKTSGVLLPKHKRLMEEKDIEEIIEIQPDMDLGPGPAVPPILSATN